MIIYGKDASKGQLIKLNNFSCTECKKEETIFVQEFLRYAHIFFIPTFPISKEFAGICTNCKTKIEHGNFYPKTISELNLLTKETKRPLWQFAGLIIFGLFFIYAAFFWRH